MDHLGGGRINVKERMGSLRAINVCETDAKTQEACAREMAAKRAF